MRAAENPANRVASEDHSQPSPLKYEYPKYLTGEIYSQSGSKRELLFRFERRAVREGNKLDVRRAYTYPDGRVAAKERVIYDGDQLAFFVLEESQSGGNGSAQLQRSVTAPEIGSIELTYSPAQGASTKTNTESLRPNTLVNDMVGVFLVSHWDSLARGDKLRCRYVVVPRRETIGFTFVKTSEAVWEGREAVIVRMEATSLIIGALVKPLYFTIEKRAPHRVLQYVGRTLPKLKDGAQWKDLDAITVFDWQHAQL